MSHQNKTDINGNREEHANRDPISGAPGAHPLGTGVGAALGGAAAGAAAGTVVGPVGTVVGAAVGAIVGGLAGKGVAEVIDPTSEAAYWRENFKTRPYAANAASFDCAKARSGIRAIDGIEKDQARFPAGPRGVDEPIEYELCWDPRTATASLPMASTRDAASTRSRVNCLGIGMPFGVSQN